MQAETLKQQISAAKGEVDAELVLKRAKVVNVLLTKSKRPMWPSITGKSLV